MNDKAFRVLEYNKIIDMLQKEAVSDMTREFISRLTPSLDIDRIREMLTETSEAVTVIMKKGNPQAGRFYYVTDWVNLALKGGVLSMKQLLEILFNLQSARYVRGFLKSDLPALNRIQGLADIIVIHKALEEEIEQAIISEDEMADNASPALKNIRRRISFQKESIRNRLNSILASADNRALLQDSLVTMRQGRYVIPVKQEHKNRVPGIIHDQSATGATLFIEPQTIVNLNNELRELELEEKKEIQRILAELSSHVATVGEEIKNNQNILIELDYIFAKGKLAFKLDAIEPDINPIGYLHIKEGRHPLIDAKKVVPITVELGKNFNTLVITGPNTGGKTVTLKTVGLFVLMAQTGLHIPAAAGTQIPVFKKVFADIGDEQSIEQSLSTFSSHMSNIVDIMDYADEKSLVLLDELGAGTDPTEGAALAISILDELFKRKVKTIATTHYTELKKYAIAGDGVENASMEFDVETLSPTFRLMMGTPGRSNAFEISKKLGLSDNIIEHAKSLLEWDDIAFEDVITSIEEDKRKAEEERDEAIFLNLQIKKQKEDLEKQRQQFEEKKNKIIAKAREEAKDILKDVKEFADQVQRELKDIQNLENPEDIKHIQHSLRAKLRKKQKQFQDKLEIQENLEPVEASDLRLGDRVKILTLNQKGHIITLPDDKNEIQVQVGLMKISVNINQIVKLEENKRNNRKNKASYGKLYHSKLQNVSPTINVVGKVLDDALIEVDKYLDDAFVAGLKEVTVIHGRGAGILRDGLNNMFRNHKHVAEARKGHYNEGGDGVTIVTLK